jgi:hypothetical protein
MSWSSPSPVAGAWYAWLYLLSPPSDQDRIRAEQIGVDDERVVAIRRAGARFARRIYRPSEIVIGNGRLPVGVGKWFRLYDVTLATPDGLDETRSVGVEAGLFGGQPEVRRFDVAE